MYWSFSIENASKAFQSSKIKALIYKMTTTFQKKVIYSFNIFYLDFLTDLKKYNDESKQLVRKHYKVFDKASPQYFERFQTSLLEHVNNAEEVEMLPEASFISIKSNVGVLEESVLKSYLCIFRALVSIYSDEDETILETVLDVIKTIQDPSQNDEVINHKMKDILDDDLAKILGDLKDLHKVETSEEDDRNVFNMIEKSKIGSIAKEISNEIDISSLPLDSPEKLLDISNLSSSNNVLGNIISQVSTKIQKKIEDGQISQTELVNEALSLVGMMNQGNNSLFNDLMSGMAGGAMGGGYKGTKVQVDKNKVKNMETRDRLRQKLEKKKQEQQKQQP
jgi:hypothetical protein